MVIISCGLVKAALQHGGPENPLHMSYMYVACTHSSMSYSTHSSMGYMYVTCTHISMSYMYVTCTHRVA